MESKLKTYEEIVRKNPNNIELKKMISSEFHTYGREDNLKIELLKTDKDAYQSSITRLIKSLQYNPENVEALISYGEILFYKSNLPLSKEQFQTALNINKALPEAHYYLGKIYMAENNIPLAEASFIRLLGILSKHAKIRAKKIDALKTLRMLAKEKPKTLKTTLKTIEEQLSLLYFESNKVNLEYNTNYNNSSYMKEKFKAAVKSSEEKIENEPTSAAHWIKLGSNFYHLKKYGKSAEAFKKALELNTPRWLEVTQWQCISLCFDNKIEEAHHELDLALKKVSSKEQKAILTGLKSWLFYTKGETVQMTEQLNIAIRLNNTYYYLWYLKALVHMGKKEYEESLSSITKAIELDGSKKNMIRDEEIFDPLKKDIRFWDLVLSTK